MTELLKMPCPTCNNTILTAIETHREISAEAYSFIDERNNRHDHMSDLVVTRWKCKNNHEFQLKGKVQCLGCALDRYHSRSTETQHPNLIRTKHSIVDDHHHDLNKFDGNGPSLA